MSWREKIGKKYCKVETAARILGEPVGRTQERIRKRELVLEVRNGESLLPTPAVERLRDRLLREREASSAHGVPNARGTEGRKGYYYSLEQAKAILRVDGSALYRMVTRGELRAERAGGQPWFPSKPFDDFVRREYGKGTLMRAPNPYSVSEVRRRAGEFPKGTDDRPADVASSRRSEAKKVSARTVDANPVKTAKVESDLGEESTEGYLSIREAASELGESIDDVLSRIGKRQLATEQARGMVVLRRRDVLALKANIEQPAPSSPEDAAPERVLGTPPDRVPGRSVAGEGGGEPETTADAEGAQPAQQNHEEPRAFARAKAWLNKLDDIVRPLDKDVDPHQEFDGESREVVREGLSEELRKIREEAQGLRAQLETEKRLRLNSERLLEDLRGQLDRKKTREGKVLEQLTDARAELGEARARIAALEEEKRVLDGIRRLVRDGEPGGEAYLPDSEKRSVTKEPSVPSPPRELGTEAEERSMFVLETLHGTVQFEPPIPFNERDRRLLRLLASYGELTSEQLRRQFGSRLAPGYLDDLIYRLEEHEIFPIEALGDRYRFEPTALQNA